MGKISLRGTQKKVKNRCRWSEKTTADISPTNFSNGIALISLENWWSPFLIENSIWKSDHFKLSYIAHLVDRFWPRFNVSLGEHVCNIKTAGISDGKLAFPMMISSANISLTIMSTQWHEYGTQKHKQYHILPFSVKKHTSYGAAWLCSFCKTPVK